MRVIVAQRKRQRNAKIIEALQQEQERQISRINCEADAIAGYERFHQCHTSLKVIVETSTGISVWARYGRKAQLRGIADVSSTVIGVPEDKLQIWGNWRLCRAWCCR